MDEFFATPSDVLAVRLPAGIQTSDRADEAFTHLYQAAFSRMYAFVRAQINDTAAAEEITGRVFLKAYLHRHRLPDGDAAMQWLFRVAHNTLIDYVRVEGRRQRASVPLGDIHHLAHERQADPEAQYAAKERATLVFRAMAALDEPERTLLALKFVADRTNLQIAEILGISPGAVSMRALRALERLRRMVAEMSATTPGESGN